MNRLGWMFLAVTFVGNASAQDYGNQPIMGNQDMILSDAQIQSYSENALRGDSDAANQLASFYLIVKNNRTEAERWYRIAAENGDIKSQRSYGSLLVEDWKTSQNNQTKIRGMFWLKKSADAGDPVARNELDKLKK
jgi:TPR repeat protein